MAGFFNIPFDLNSIYAFATSNTFSFWISIAVNLILSTLIGGVLLVIIVEVFGHEFGEDVSSANAFLVVLAANIINLVVIMGFLLPYIASIPFAGIFLPLAVWLFFIKMFFGELSMTHAVIVAVVFYLISIYAVPNMVSYVKDLLPLGF